MPTPQELAMALRQSGQDMAGQQMAAPQSWQGGMGAMGNMGMNGMQQQAPQMSQPMQGMNGQAAMQSMPQGAQIIPQPQVNTGLSPQEAAYLQSLSR